MAFAFVNPVRQAWAHQGLRYLLKEFVPQAVQTAQGSASKVVRAANPPKNPVSSVLGPAENAPAKQAEKQANPVRWCPTPVMEWPVEWRQLLQLTPRALFAWTYLELGKDLMEARQKQPTKSRNRQIRSQLLRSMLKNLGHPSGTHTFWPMSLDGQPSGIGVEMFWSGLPSLGCRGVVIMGSAAACELVPGNKLRPLLQLRHNGQLVWIIDDPLRLNDQPLAYERVLKFLANEMQLILRSRKA